MQSKTRPDQEPTQGTSMAPDVTPSNSAHGRLNATAIAGLTLMAIGAVILADQYLKTGWLKLLAVPVGGMIFLVWGIQTRRLSLIVPGGLLSGLGIGAFLALNQFLNLSFPARAGLLLVAFALGWGVITLASAVFTGQVAWWPLIPGSVLASIGACLMLTPLRVVDFTLYGCVGLGLAFLAWGLGARLFGLLIPGTLLVTIGPGIYQGWGHAGEFNGLTETGVMLVYFALGWALITIFSRIVINRFIWWPLIPGGILAMTGYGLYLGGNPQHAVTFISNTGSIGLILFGLYLLLWRSGLKK
jgi:hypothetical protein